MNAKLPWVIACASAAVAFGVFATRRTEIKEVIREVPKEVIREIPKEVIVEKIREIPKEVIVEKITPLSNLEKAQILFGKRVLDAKAVSGNEILKDIGSVSPRVIIGDEMKENVETSELQTKLELKLRTHGVPIDKKDGERLFFIVEGLWQGDTKNVLCFHAELAVKAEIYRLNSKSKFDRFAGILWQTGYNGYAGRSRLKDSVANTLDSVTDSFVNAYLEQNPKNPPQEASTSGATVP